jgi:hypothetical protein
MEGHDILDTNGHLWRPVKYADKIYYWNTNTNETTWNTPRGVGSGELGAPDEEKEFEESMPNELDMSEIYRMILVKASNKAIEELSESFALLYWREIFPGPLKNEVDMMPPPFSGLANRIPDIFKEKLVNEFKPKLKELDALLQQVDLPEKQSVGLLQYFLDFAAQTRAARLELVVGIADPARRVRFNEQRDTWFSRNNKDPLTVYSKNQQTYISALIRTHVVRSQTYHAFNSYIALMEQPWVDSESQEAMKKLLNQAKVNFNSLRSTLFPADMLDTYPELPIPEDANVTRPRLEYTATNPNVAKRQFWRFIKAISSLSRARNFYTASIKAAQDSYVGTPNLKDQYGRSCSGPGKCKLNPCLYNSNVCAKRLRKKK